MSSYLNTMRSIGTARLAVMGIVAIVLVGFFIFLMSRMSAEPMSVLYTDLSSSDAGAVGQKLDALKIPFEVNPEGTSIKVAADQVGRARMALAQDGLPSGGSFGYHEIFDQNQGFGTTSFMENLNQVRALEGELSRTVSSLAPVKSARIHLVLPKRELFSHDQQQATASVVLSLRPGAGLSREQISAVQHLIASAVPQLKPGQVSIVDDHGNLLARPEDSDSDDAQAANDDEMRHSYEKRLSNEIETLVGRTVGDGKVRATVTADMDFDKVSTNQETFDPDQQVVRSTQTVDEKNDAQDSQKDSVRVGRQQRARRGGDRWQRYEQHDQGHAVGRDDELRDRQDHPYAGPPGWGGQEIVHRRTGRRHLHGTDADGKTTYAPRSKDEMAQIEAIVRSAAGYDAKRGDVIDVANMKFVTDTDAGTALPDTTIAGFERTDIIHLAETAVLGIVALLVVLLVVRPILSRLGQAPESGDGTAALALAGLGGQQALGGPSPGGGMEALEQPGGTTALLTGDGAEDDTMINLSRVEGRVRASSLRKIGEIVDKHPSEAVSIIRGWMYQES